MKRFILLGLIGLFLSIDAYAFETLLFKPLTANVFEPRVGAFYQFGADKLRLDIGTSVDLAEFKLSDDQAIRIGGDFFTYTRLRTQSNFKFPVETSDYFFGANATAKTKLFGRDFYSRLRIAHISSHVVDGLSDSGVFNKMPFVWSREFLDYTVATNFDMIRAYAGVTYVFSTRPKVLAKVIPQIGFDTDIPLNNSIKFRAGYDFKLSGYFGEKYGVNSAQAGLLFNTSASTGLFVGWYGYSGPSMHGMFYTSKDKYSGVGFQLVF